MGGQIFHNWSALNFITCYPSSEVPSYQLTNMHTKSINSTISNIWWNDVELAFTCWHNVEVGCFFTVLRKQSHFLYGRSPDQNCSLKTCYSDRGSYSLEKFRTNILNRMWPLSSTWILQVFCQSAVQNLQVIIHSKNQTKFRIMTMNEYANRLLVNKQLSISKFYQQTKTCK